MPTQYVSIIRAGWFAAKALENPEKYTGRIIPLAGDHLSISEVQDAYQKANGVRPWKAPIPAVLLRLLPYEVKTMFQVGTYPVIHVSIGLLGRSLVVL